MTSRGHTMADQITDLAVDMAVELLEEVHLVDLQEVDRMSLE